MTSDSHQYIIITTSYLLTTVNPPFFQSLFIWKVQAFSKQNMLMAFCLQVACEYITQMGQKQSSQLGQSAPTGHVIEHPRFKQARLLSDKSGECIQISVPILSEGQLATWQKGFRALLAHDCLFLPLSFEFQRTQLCGSNGICKVKFDNYPFLLKDEIANRGGKPGKPFQTEELWYLGLSLMEAGGALHSRGEKVGDVQPANVFINDNGQAKVACQHSWPHQLDNYQKTVFQKVVTYLAPQEIRDLHFGLTETKADLAFAESFSIGLTLLDSATLNDSTDLYSVSAFRIDYQKLEERKLALRAVSTVDEIFRQIILGLTEVDPKERLSCIQVLQWMEQYREHIVNMQSFEIRQLPPWAKPIERKSLQVLKPHSHPPFYVDNKHYQPIIYEEPKIVYQRQIMPAPQQLPQWQAQNPTIQQIPIQPYRFQPISEPYRQQQNIEMKPDFAIQSYPDVGVYESSYVQVPAYAPTIGKAQDFRSTLQKIDEQLAVSRKMFPIN